MNPTELWFNDINLINEWKNHIEQFYESHYGNCYRFNSGFNWTNQSIELKKSKKISAEEGLWLTLYANTSLDFGELKIYIHNYTENPKNIYRKGSLISSGANNYFLVKRTLDQKLESPFNECLKDINQFPFNKTIIDYLNKTNRKYNQVECFNLCFNLYYNQTNPCNCNLDSLDDILYIKCSYNIKRTNLNVSNCTDNFIETFQSSDPFEKCSKYCPLECDSNKLLVSLNTRELPRTGNITKGFDYTEFKTYENVSKSFFSIYVYYEDLDYTLIEQIPKIQIFDLISNIGGLFGLFLGKYNIFIYYWITISEVSNI